ncbi:MAG: AMP-binding protein, partial [Pseudoxanthomonas sp.]
MSTLTLLDVLPCRAEVGAGPSQQLAFDIDPLVVAGLHSCVEAPAAMLQAALVLVESRLTGNDADTSDCDSVTWCAVGDQTTASASALSTWQLLLAEGRLEIEFKAPLTEQAIRIVAACVQRVLAAQASGDAVESDAIELLDPAERQSLLHNWNNTGRQTPSFASVHGCFAAMRDATPDALAVVDGVTSLTYAGLDARATVLARKLRKKGVAAGEVVAVAMNRSVEAVVAVLGVLKAGAAYLPLDATHPADRLNYMLEDACVRVAILDVAHATLPLSDSVQRVIVNDLALHDDTAVNDSAVNDDVAVDAESLAYVMYTSGSTGMPKGVEIPHRGILRLVVGVDYADLGPSTRMLHCAPLGFDASTLEIWGPLLNGGRVVIHDEALPTGAGLATSIRRHGVTTVWLTAALFNAVVDEDPQQLAD